MSRFLLKYKYKDVLLVFERRQGENMLQFMSNAFNDLVFGALAAYILLSSRKKKGEGIDSDTEKQQTTSSDPGAESIIAADKDDRSIENKDEQ